jgi:hypothetical protein
VFPRLPMAMAERGGTWAVLAILAEQQPLIAMALAQSGRL